MNQVLIGLFGSTWVIGEKSRDHGVNLLLHPLLFLIMKDRMMVHRLPGDPDSIPLDAAFFNYAVRDEQVMALYVKATTGIDTPAEPMIKLVR